MGDGKTIFRASACPFWSREAFDQTNARLWRRGQEHPVTVHVVIADGTVDTLVMARLEHKGGNHAVFIAHITDAAVCNAAEATI